MDKMKVFLSWSGNKSLHVARALHDWLPEVIQAIDPWLSDEDIAKGSLWGGEMTTQLNQIGVGIICVTPDNQDAPWLNFEAGALSKTVKQSVFVCPYLIGLTKADLKSPLSLFQAAEANKSDTLKVVLSVNKALGDQARTEANVQQTFNKWWPDLESKLEEAASINPSRGPERPQREILEEILLLMRDMNQAVRFRDQWRQLYDFNQKPTGPNYAYYVDAYGGDKPVGGLTNLEHLAALANTYTEPYSRDRKTKKTPESE